MEQSTIASFPGDQSLLWQDISNLTVPTIFKGKIGTWECAKWSIEDWAAKCEEISLNFRCGSKSNLSLLETDSVNITAKLKDFVLWLETKSENLLSENPLRKFDVDNCWAYSSYNYMARVFQDMPSMLSIVNWSNFGLSNRGGYDSTLWIGSQGSNTPCHQDSYGSNLVAQLVGEKLWVMFPPESGAMLYPTRVPYEESSVFSSVNILHPDLTAFPRFRGTKPYVVVLKAGDVLYLPPKWWHFVYCLDTAVSINTWVEHKLDDLWRLEEAVARFLMTAFIPQYAELKSDWLNPTEELLSCEKTAALLHMAVDRALAEKTGTSSLDSEPKRVVRSSDVLESATKLVPITFEDFEEQMRSRKIYERMCGYQNSDSLVCAVNCFLSANVLKTIADGLLENNK